MMMKSHFNEVELLIDTIEKMKDDLALVCQRFDSVIDNNPKLKEIRDEKR
tara:strand:- start:338 stop:487 length:150 start_codon:yes stop_codon:yes gene_type:complete